MMYFKNRAHIEVESCADADPVFRWVGPKGAIVPIFSDQLCCDEQARQMWLSRLPWKVRVIYVDPLAETFYVARKDHWWALSALLDASRQRLRWNALRWAIRTAKAVGYGYGKPGTPMTWRNIFRKRPEN